MERIGVKKIMLNHFPTFLRKIIFPIEHWVLQHNENYKLQMQQINRRKEILSYADWVKWAIEHNISGTAFALHPFEYRYLEKALHVVFTQDSNKQRQLTDLFLLGNHHEIYPVSSIGVRLIDRTSYQRESTATIQIVMIPVNHANNFSMDIVKAATKIKIILYNDVKQLENQQLPTLPL